MTVGPDGALFIAGWNDKNTNRIYRLQSGPFYDVPFARSINTNLSFRTLPLENLIQLLGSRKDFFAVRSRRILAEKRDQKMSPILHGNMFNAPDEHLQLESFWALYAAGRAEQAFLDDCLGQKSPLIRCWAVRFLGDEESLSLSSEQRLLKLAEKESDLGLLLTEVTRVI